MTDLSTCKTHAHLDHTSAVTLNPILRAWVLECSIDQQTEFEKGSAARLLGSTGQGRRSSLRYDDTAQRTYGEAMMWVVGEMLRAMTGGPSYVPRESVCTQQEPPQQVQVKYEAQRNEEVSILTVYGSLMYS